MHLDPASGIPLYLQIVDGLRLRVASGELGPGAEVPSLRAMAAELRVNYHTLARAYQAIEAEGLIARHRGGAYVVTAGAGERARRRILEHDIDRLCERAHALGVVDLVERVRARFVRLEEG